MLADQTVVAVRSATGLDGVETWSKGHGSHRPKYIRTDVQSAARVFVPEGRERHDHFKLTIAQGEERWKHMMTELGGCWRMSAMSDT